VAAEVLDDFPDGVWFVRLSRLTDPGLVLPTVAQTLGVPQQGGQPMAETLRAYLRDRCLLLLLDNFEQVVGAAPEIGALLEVSPGLKLLATSRIPLRLRGEHEYPLAPLPLPEPGRLPPPEQLSQYGAVALFVERACEARPDFAVTAANAPAVAEICARLDGLPLAIELAATRVKLLPPEALLARLSTRLKLLTGGARDLKERQRTSWSTLAWSEDLLGPQERTLFRRLAVFVGGCTLEAAEAVCKAPKGAAPLGVDVLEGLGVLVDQSLVQQREESGEPRFGMLHVVREYAMEQLEAAGEAEAVRRAHLTYFLDLGDQFLRAEQATWSSLEMRSWHDRIECEYDNVRAALSWARARATEAHAPGGVPPGTEPFLEAGLRLTGSLLWFWDTRGHIADRAEWLESFWTLDAADAGAEPGEAATRDRGVLAVRARILHGMGIVAFGRGDDNHAVALLERSVALYRAGDDRRGALCPLQFLADVAAEQGDRARATARVEECLALAREAFGPLGAMIPLSYLARLALVAGDLDLAQARSEEALDLSVLAGQLATQADNLHVQALVAYRRGQPDRAAALARKALEVMWAGGYRGNCSETLELCAIVLAAQEQAERAARVLGASEAHRERIGVQREVTGWPPTPQDIEVGVSEARAALGEERWAAAVAAGRLLSLDEAVAEALLVSPQSAVLPHGAFGNIASRRK
jgi:predicted ATPase